MSSVESEFRFTFTTAFETSKIRLISNLLLTNSSSPVMIGDIDIRKFGSQGQQRTAALSLKLSEIELVKKLTKDTPLLDDFIVIIQIIQVKAVKLTKLHIHETPPLRRPVFDNRQILR